MCVLYDMVFGEGRQEGRQEGIVEDGERMSVEEGKSVDVGGSSTIKTREEMEKIYEEEIGAESQ